MLPKPCCKWSKTVKPVKSCALFILCLGLATATMQAKDREWKTGKLLDEKPAKAQKVPNQKAYAGELWDYTVDGGKCVWVMQRDLHLRNDLPLLVTVNAPVKFAVEKHNAYLLDDDGKEHKLAILAPASTFVIPKKTKKPKNTKHDAPKNPPVAPDAGQAIAQSESAPDSKH